MHCAFYRTVIVVASCWLFGTVYALDSTAPEGIQSGIVAKSCVFRAVSCSRRRSCSPAAVNETLGISNFCSTRNWQVKCGGHSAPRSRLEEDYMFKGKRRRGCYLGVHRLWNVIYVPPYAIYIYLGKWWWVKECNGVTESHSFMKIILSFCTQISLLYRQRRRSNNLWKFGLPIV